MSKVLYLDCFSGISGDMFLGAMLDIGASPARIRQGLSSLGLDAAFDLVLEKTARQGITGTRFDVLVHPEPPMPETNGHGHPHEHEHEYEHDHEHEHKYEHDQSHDHEHGYDHPHESEKVHQHGRSYADIVRLIKQSALSSGVKDRAQSIFAVIAEAEAAVHGVAIGDVHFHEVGAIDSIVDIVGAALALEDLGVDQIICSPLVDGSGTIRCQHGIIPVPVPAVARMLRGTDIPFSTSDCPTELITPTGMAIIKAVCTAFGKMPPLHLKAVGYGFGQRDIGRLNALRAFLGETETGVPSSPVNPQLHRLTQVPVAQIDPVQVVLLECQVDNTTGEALGHAADRLIKAGALDVSLIPVFMKKFRPGTLIQITAKPETEQPLVEILFAETGTIGVRRQLVERYTMSREWVTVTTPDGTASVKVVHFGNLTKAYPEYADVVALAESTGRSFPEIGEQIMMIYRQQHP